MRMSLKYMTEEEKQARKRQQKNEAQKRYYQKNKEYYKNYQRKNNFYLNKIQELQDRLDDMVVKLYGWQETLDPTFQQQMIKIARGEYDETKDN